MSTVIDAVVSELAPTQAEDHTHLADQTGADYSAEAPIKAPAPKGISGKQAAMALRVLTGDSVTKLRGTLGASDTAVALGFKPIAKAGKNYSDRVSGVQASLDLVRDAMRDPRCVVSDGEGGSIRFDLAVRMKLGAAKDIKGLASKALGYASK